MRCRRSPLESQALERGGDGLAAQSVPDVNREALAREEIDHGQGAKPSSIRQLVGHEIHTPDVVARRRWTSLLPVDRRRVTPRAFPSQGQTLLGIEPIKALFADVPAFAP